MEITKLLKALGDETRFRIIQILRRSEERRVGKECL